MYPDGLVKSFEEINKFIEENKREPELSNDILENSLYYRLEGIREDNNKINQLKGFDTFGLLKETEETPQPQSIDDILNDDDLGLLSTPNRSSAVIRAFLGLTSNRPKSSSSTIFCNQSSIFRSYC